MSCRENRIRVSMGKSPLVWAAAVAITAIFFAGCAKPALYVGINGYLDSETQQGIAPGATVYVIKDERAKNPFLEKEVKRTIESLLGDAGYSIAARKEAKYYLYYSYGIGKGRKVTEVVSEYEFGDIAYIDTFDEEGHVKSKIIRYPDRKYYVPVTSTIYDRWLTISVIDAAHYRDTGKSQVVWMGEVSSTGGRSDLRGVLKYLLVAGFERFGQNTGEVVYTEINEDDERVLKLMP